MGDPKKQKNKYQSPSHPWQRARLEKEAVLRKEYGLHRKNEIWKMQSLLRKFKQQAKKLIARTDAQSKIEQTQLISRLYKLGLIEKESSREKILDIDERAIFERRLQTLVFKLGLARSITQARQLIVHGHILVNDKKVSVPSYIVRRDEENKIKFDPASSFNNIEHPERKILQKTEKPKVEVKA